MGAGIKGNCPSRPARLSLDFKVAQGRFTLGPSDKRGSEEAGRWPRGEALRWFIGGRLLVYHHQTSLGCALGGHRAGDRLTKDNVLHPLGRTDTGSQETAGADANFHFEADRTERGFDGAIVAHGP